MNSPSTVTTERLVLARHQPHDFDDCVAMWRDPAVVRLIRPTPFDESETWSRMLRYVGHWEFMEFGYWTIRTLAGGEFCGEIGFAYTHREVPAEYAGAPEFGCTLVQSAWGRNIAKEATHAALGWMDQERGLNRTIALTAEANRAAIALAQSAGYVRRQQVPYEGHAFVLMERGVDGQPHPPRPHTQLARPSSP
ncbi:GNAT family N-acetyltransferase [Stenotrophomonas sp. S39]|uniref:GNAT family N-acetyltransferase n=1 Tax=Stenotrophomonas sp. S39 TaxID=2767451 RepID=UPI00190B0704|nr:GNAT family N-acetyltransferase [Stenotrophomonas sp. S39]MBK0055993.1 GNAT family N-acetyltransferase [Stenotrophomonas sp. S39]